MSLRDTILSAPSDKTRIPVVVPEWGGVTVYATTMDGLTQVRYADALKAVPAGTPASAVLIVFATEDEQGNPIFTVEDIPALAKKGAAGLNRVFTAIDSLTPSLDELKKSWSNPQPPSSP